MDINANLNRLKYFQAVCKYGSVTKAADELRISQPSVTTALKDLEKVLGVVLFSRKNRKLILTKDGEYILDLTNQILRDIENFFAKVLDLSEQVNTKVRLGIPPIIGSLFVTKIYEAATEKLPHIILEINELGGAFDVLDALDAGALDLAVIINSTIPASFNHIVFHQTSIHFCIGRKHALAQKKYIRCEDVLDLPLAILSKGSYHDFVINQMFEEAGMTPHTVLHSLESSTIRNLIVHHGVGTFTCKDVFANDPEIVTIPCVISEVLEIAVLWAKNKYINKNCRDVISLISTIPFFPDQALQT